MLKLTVKNKNRRCLHLTRPMLTIIDTLVHISNLLSPGQRSLIAIFVVTQLESDNFVGFIQPDYEIKVVIREPSPLRFSLDLPDVSNLSEHRLLDPFYSTVV